MARFGRQIDIFAAIDQALGEDSVSSKQNPAPPAPTPPAKTEADAYLQEQIAKIQERIKELQADSKRNAALYIGNGCVGIDAGKAATPLTRHVEPPPGDTSTMSAGQLHEWCRAAEVRCQWAFNKSNDPAWCPQLLDARDFYVHCRTLLMLSLERTYAHLFLLPWQAQVAALPDVDTARALEFVQGKILMDGATTEHRRHYAGGLIMGSGGRLERLGLIPPGAPVAARDGAR